MYKDDWKKLEIPEMVGSAGAGGGPDPGWDEIFRFVATRGLYQLFRTRYRESQNFE